MLNEQHQVRCPVGHIWLMSREEIASLPDGERILREIESGGLTEVPEVSDDECYECTTGKPLPETHPLVATIS